MNLTKKQTQALDVLEDDITTELLFGGGAGGGKSALGVYWLMKCCLKYPGTRWLIGRSKLKQIKETTLNSFFDIAKLQGLQSGVHYNYNQQSNVITFYNQSEILLKDLFLYPTDPNYDSLGSLEITGAFIDECNQITEKAWNIVMSRIRYKLDDYGLIPKLLGTCNPSKNYVYTRFYKPAKLKTLKPNMRFIQALVTDNRYISEHYIENLKKLDKASKQRLLFGNWEYDDDPAVLCSYDNILAMFTNDHVSGGNKYITADIARMGSDKAIIFVWEGWKVIEKVVYDVSRTTEIQNAINALRVKHQIPKHKCVADEDGVGGGVVDNCGIYGFVNNSHALPAIQPKYDEKGKPITENYYNLQSQCGYKLAEIINLNQIYFECDLSDEDQAEIIEDIEQLKSYNTDKDGKLRILPKEKVKELIGRSPDWRDVLLMRALFEYKYANYAKYAFGTTKS